MFIVILGRFLSIFGTQFAAKSLDGTSNSRRLKITPKVIPMKALWIAAAAIALVGGAVSSPSLAQDRHPGWGQDYNGDHSWRRGDHMGYNDWSQAAPVDYRSHHLRHPPHGYEWRESNGKYVLAAVATGVIASIILSHGH